MYIFKKMTLFLKITRPPQISNLKENTRERKSAALFNKLYKIINLKGEISSL